MLSRGLFEVRAARLIGAAIAMVSALLAGLLLSPSIAQAWEVDDLSIKGAGKVTETTSANLVGRDCSPGGTGGLQSPSSTPTGSVGASCTPGDPHGDYGHGWTVRYVAEPKDGFRFVKWQNGERTSRKPVICDGSGGSSDYTGAECQFQIWGNLQTQAVFEDVTAPSVSITGGPAAGSTSGRSVSFTFDVTNHPSDQPVSYRCKLTGPAGIVHDWQACSSSGKSYSSLSDGSHTFSVEAKDPSGNYTTASRAWNVDAVAPETTLMSDGPAEGSTVSSNNATFQWIGSSDTQKYFCQVDTGSVVDPCSSPRSTGTLSDGTHTFKVWAQDTHGNVEDSPARRTWTVDTTPPSLDITSGPENDQTFGQGSAQTWNFSASDATSGVSSVQCTVVATGSPESFGPCSGGSISHTVSNLPVGFYTFKVRATDRVGKEAVQTRSFSILPSLRISDVRVKEKKTNAVFTVRLSAASQQTITVNYATANGSAKAPADYTAKAGTLTFAPRQTAQTIAVPIRSDRRNERNEVFFVKLSGANSATIADASGKGTIIDND